MFSDFIGHFFLTLTTYLRQSQHYRPIFGVLNTGMVFSIFPVYILILAEYHDLQMIN
jgi:hypothetical protein